MARRPSPARAGRGPANLTMTLRRWHGYVGALIAPSILFFAFSGGLQLFTLHESHDGYVAPAWIKTLASVHKDQVLKKEGRHGPKPAAKRPAPPADADDHDEGPNTPAAPTAAQIRSWVLKWEFVLVALGLIGSTVMGLWIAFQDPRRRRSTLILLAIGALLPLVTLFV